MATKPFAVGEGWRVDDASLFQVGTLVFPRFSFPFTVMDPTPGGKNLGRIEWNIEILPGKKPKGRAPVIGALAVWARQTRDPRYQGVIFHLPCYTDMLHSNRDRDDFTKFVWRVGFCEVHKGSAILAAYPDDKHSKLIIDVGSSISGEAYFE